MAETLKGVEIAPLVTRGYEQYAHQVSGSSYEELENELIFLQSAYDDFNAHLYQKELDIKTKIVKAELEKRIESSETNKLQKQVTEKNNSIL